MKVKAKKLKSGGFLLSLDTLNRTALSLSDQGVFWNNILSEKDVEELQELPFTIIEIKEIPNEIQNL